MEDKSHLQHLLADRPGSSEPDLEFPQRAPGRERRRKVRTVGLLVKVLVSCFVVVAACAASFWAGTRVPFRVPKEQPALDGDCAAHMSFWSPVLKDVSIQYQHHNFNGSFMAEDIYRQQGSPEVDEAWEALGIDYRAGVISYEDGLASGLGPSFVQRADRYGGGFLVNVEGMHHLHCLNLLRKSLYFNYDRYKALGHHAFQNDEHILRRHVSKCKTHCLDTVRQVLMCNVDTGVLGQVWVNPEAPSAFPDFNTKHVCKNYDNVREWARKLQAPPVDQLPKDYLAPPHPGDVMTSIP